MENELNFWNVGKGGAPSVSVRANPRAFLSRRMAASSLCFASLSRIYLDRGMDGGQRWMHDYGTQLAYLASSSIELVAHLETGCIVVRHTAEHGLFPRCLPVDAGHLCTRTDGERSVRTGESGTLAGYANASLASCSSCHDQTIETASQTVGPCNTL